MTNQIEVTYVIISELRLAISGRKENEKPGEPIGNFEGNFISKLFWENREISRVHYSPLT